MKNRARNPKLKGRAINPLRLDPTRTTTLRKAAIADVRRRFARLALAIDELIVRQDSFGLERRRNGPPSPFAINAFCPTGEGGGIDNSCSPGESLGRVPDDVSWTPKDALNELQGSLYGSKFGGYSVVQAHLRGATKHYGISLTKSQVESLTSAVDENFSPSVEPLTRYRGIKVSKKMLDGLKVGEVISDPGYASTSSDRKVANQFAKPNSFSEKPVVLKIDIPAGTMIVKDVAKVTGEAAGLGRPEKETLLPRGTKMRVKSVRGNVVSVDVVDDVTTNHYLVKNVFCPTGEGGGVDPKLTTNERWELKSSPEQLAAFQEWLKKQLRWYVVGMTEDQLWARYVQEGFRKGAGRAFDDLRSKRGPTFRSDDFLQGERRQFFATSFRRPETVEKVKILASRTFEELNNVGEEIKLKLGRTLTDGLARGDNPRTIAREMRDKLAIPQRRAETIARTEIIRAHAEGQLAAMEELGVDEVGVMVEWSTAGDDRVCEACLPMEGVVLKLSEATGMIPRHPNCRCSFIPANVGESREGQTRGKAKIERAIDLSARLAGDTFDQGITIDRDRPRALVTPTKNAFCPTGPGGGVDPTCGSTDVSGGSSHFEAMERSSDALAQRWNVPDHVIDKLNTEDSVKPSHSDDPKKAFVYSAIRAWQGSSGGPVATEIVRGAMEHAKIDSSGIRKSEGSDRWFAEHPEERDALHSLGKEMYKSTQEWLASQGVKELTLYRKGATDRPFSSWTTKPGWVRQETAGEVVSRKIPASHILSVPATGFGSRDEHEVVVLGGHGR